MTAPSNTPADQKALALSFALTALIKTLADSGALEMDAFMRDLSGARTRLDEIGEPDAAALLGALAESFQGIG